jgi:PAS domain S-box-containing protein
MGDFLRRLFDPTAFQKKGTGAGWTDALVFLHRASDALIFLAFLAIPLLLVYFARRRQDLPNRTALWLFGSVVVLASLTFFLDVLAFSTPLVWLEGILKAATALVAWATVFALVPALPKALALRSPEDLQREIDRRREVEDDLREAHALLEKRVAHRTAQLATANRRLTAEVAAREGTQRRLLAKDTITHALAESELLEDAAPRILKALGEALGWPLGAIWEHDPSADRMRPVAVWHRPGVEAKAFEAATGSLSVGRGEELPGRVWDERFVVWLPDVAADAPALRKAAVAEAGLRAAFAFPILADDRVLGVIEFFDREIKSPDQPLLDMVESIGSQIGQFVERRRVQQELRRRNAELRLLTDSLPALISYVDAERKYRFHNKAYEAWFGERAADQVGKTLEEALGAEAYAAIAPYVDRALAGERVTYEARLPFATGVRFVHAVYVPDVAPDGKVRGYFALTNDISERKAAEERLRESEQRFRTMANSAPVFIATLDADAKVDFVNRAWVEFRGRSLADEAQGGATDVIHPDDRVAALESVGAGFARRRPVSVELRLRRADGEYRWIMGHATPRFTSAGRFEGFIATGIDITDRRRAEQALRDGEERFRLMVEGVRDYAIHGLDPQGRVTSWNAGAERLHGYRTRDIVGEHVATFFPPEAVEEDVPQRLLGEAEREGSARDEGWRLRADGSRFFGEEVLTALRDPDGHLRGFSRVVHDVTARREADDAMRESESRMRMIVDTALDAVIAMDESGRIREWNAQAERMFGWPRREALGRTLADTVIPARYRESHLRGLARFLETGEGPVLNRRIEIEALRRDGSEVPVEIAISPVRRAGHYVFNAFLRDLSERRVLEALRRRGDDLESEKRRVEEASRLKSEFLANMSHEMRTPMNAVIGFAELLHDQKVGPVAPEHREYLGDILTSARHLLQLIDDVLDLAKVEAGKMVLHPETVALPRLVAEVRDILRALASQKRISVVLETDAGPDEVVADPKRLKQILYNYLSNALKFTPERGHVTVRTAFEEPDAFRLEVADDGAGIAPADRERLFVEFQQLDEGAAKRHPGTGLGLALTRRLAEAQGGRVGVETELGKGSTFFAVLPRDISVLPAGPGPGEVTRGRDVLVVAQAAAERARIADLLAAEGYEPETAASESEAVVRCRNRSYAAVALGRLPGPGGPDALRAIRETDRNRSTPTLVVAARPADRGLTALAVEAWLADTPPADVLAETLEGLGLREDAPVMVVGRGPGSTTTAERRLEATGRPFAVSLGPEGLLEAAVQHAPAAVLLCARPEGESGFDLVEAVRRLRALRGMPVVLWEPPPSDVPAPAPRSPAGRGEAPPSDEGAEGLLEAVASCLSARRTHRAPREGDASNGR